MRTTVNIDDHLLVWAKDVARERELTLGDLLDEALQRHLSDPLEVSGSDLPVFQGEDLGIHPGVDPRSNRSLLDAADNPDPDDQSA